MQQVADIGAKGQRARSLAILQTHVARDQVAATGLGAKKCVAGIGGKTFGRLVHRSHIAPQREDHAIRVERAEAVVNQRLVQGDDIGADRPI